MMSLGARRRDRGAIPMPGRNGLCSSRRPGSSTVVNDLSPETVPVREASLRNRMAMYGAHRLQIGLFGANCSSGRAVTMVPERWTGNWHDNLKLARMADEAGIDFLLPIGRWKGYGGDTDYQGSTLE